MIHDLKKWTKSIVYRRCWTSGIVSSFLNFVIFIFQIQNIFWQNGLKQKQTDEELKQNLLKLYEIVLVYFQK